MAFLVYAPSDEFARQGLPMVVVTGFKAKEPGSRISDRYARGARQASGCWGGTSAETWKWRDPRGVVQLM